MAMLQFPAILQAVTERAELSIEAATVGEILVQLQQQYPSLQAYLFDESDQLSSFITIYLNGNDVRFLSQLQTAVSAQDTLMLVPAMAGG